MEGPSRRCHAMGLCNAPPVPQQTFLCPSPGSCGTCPGPQLRPSMEISLPWRRSKSVETRQTRWNI
eukprot:1439989-Pyramimonas_sp.AAC.1